MLGAIVMSIYGKSDLAILRGIADRLKRRRLDKNLSQQNLAEKAGLNRTTIRDVEQGKPFSVMTLIQILRALNALEELESFLPEPGISPLQLAKLKGKERRRASPKKKRSNGGGSEW